MRDFQNSASPKLKAQIPVRQRLKKLVENYEAPPTIVTVLVIIVIIVIVALVAATSGTYYSTTMRTPKAIVVAVQGLNPNTFEIAMAGNKAPNLAFLVSNGGRYTRASTNTSSSAAALASILTGTGPFFHNVTDWTNVANIYSKLRTFLAYGKDIQLRPAVIAPPNMFSGTVADSNGICSPIGMIDAECASVGCPSVSNTAYCNVDVKQEICSGVAQLYDEFILSTIIQQANVKSALFYVQLDLLANAVDDTDNSLSTLSNIFLVDAFIARLSMTLSSLSLFNGESWLLIVTGDGANVMQQAPLFMTTYLQGLQASLRPFASPTQLIDIFPTVLSWFGAAVPSSIPTGQVQGTCSTGIYPRNC